jgi:hypothetical protein
MKAFMEGFIVGFLFTLFVIFALIPSLFLEDTARNPINFERIKTFYTGEIR